MLPRSVCHDSQFELCRDLSKDHTQLSLRRGQVLPDAFMLRVDVSGVVLHAMVWTDGLAVLYGTSEARPYAISRALAVLAHLAMSHR